MSAFSLKDTYCSCIEPQSIGSKGTAGIYKIPRGKKCSDMLPAQAHLNNWCCFYKRWQNVLGNNIIPNDTSLFGLMAKDPKTYNQQIYPWGDMGWFGPFDTQEEAKSAVEKQIFENYSFWDVLWRPMVKIAAESYEQRDIYGVVGGFNIHGQTLNRDGQTCGAVTYYSGKKIQNIIDKTGKNVTLWIWEVDGDNKLGTCVSDKNECYRYSTVINKQNFCQNNEKDLTFGNNNYGCWCCGNYVNLTSVDDLYNNPFSINIGPCGNPFQSDKRNGRGKFDKYDNRPGGVI